MIPKMVIYHGGGCADGFCAAWLFRQAFPGAEFVPAQYGEAPPDVRGKDVYIVDFSYKRPTMLDLATAANCITVLDHHKTAQQDLEGLEAEWFAMDPHAEHRLVFDMTKSGGRLAWEFLWANAKLPTSAPSGWYKNFTLERAPWLVNYTEDRDLWRHALEHTHELSAAIRSYPFSFPMWDMFHDQGTKSISPFVKEGRTILRANRSIVEAHVKNAYEIELGGEKVLAVNATVLQSEIAGELAKDRAFGVCYFDRGDGFRVYSLRSRDGGRDVSEIAKQYGGGGHAAAAGFQIPPGVRVAALVPGFKQPA